MEEKTTDALPQQDGQQDAPAAAEEEPQAPAAEAAPEAGAQEAGCEEAPPAADDGGEDDALARHVRRVIRQAEALRDAVRALERQLTGQVRTDGADQ